MGGKTDTSILPPTGGTVIGTASQGFQYDGLSRMTMATDNDSAGLVQCQFIRDSLGRTVEEAQGVLGTTRYVTNTQFTSMPATQFEYPKNRLVNSSYDVLYRRNQIIEQATSAVITSWQFFGPARVADVVLANGLTQTFMNNARTNFAGKPAAGRIMIDQRSAISDQWSLVHCNSLFSPEPAALIRGAGTSPASRVARVVTDLPVGVLLCLGFPKPQFRRFYFC